MKTMKTLPVTSDGNYTIGYNADGEAGEWPGNMATSSKLGDFITAREGGEWNDANGQVWDVVKNGNSLVWRDPDGFHPFPRGRTTRISHHD